MSVKKIIPQDTNSYIVTFPAAQKLKLEQMRSIIRKAAPDAEEVISYGMPAFRMNGMLVWFAGHTKHIGFYPRMSGISNFKKELSAYKSSKGSVQFSFDKPLPVSLIMKIVRFRVKENTERTKKK